ncbi:hypothetical protein FNU79_17750 [Deinococcus detaillensis]|uniref:Ribbon-helix-helix protein, CopG family n=1 Tax=Deinococcus detaillensis TaxID=2592048 RepID=A0A553UH41_9DEIO|nr:hypothetical protein [Deinococcus detaillensis]TSA79535.1 hypothetical protein FNU79_17750 [Deinococcus detaillensis]
MKQQVSLTLDVRLVAALDGVAATGQVTRSEMLEQLLGVGIDEHAKRKAAEQKVTLSVRVTPTTAQHLKSVATSQKTSKNAAIEYVIERGLASLIDESQTAALGVLFDRLEDVAQQAQQEHNRQTHRLAHLLSRTTLEGIATREMMTAFLTQVLKIDARPISEAAWTTAVDRLSSPSPQIRETMRQILKAVTHDGQQ